MAEWINKERVVVVAHLVFSKAFVSLHIFIAELTKGELDEWTVKWIKNQLNGKPQRVVISGVQSSWSVKVEALVVLDLSHQSHLQLSFGFPHIICACLDSIYKFFP